MKRIEQMGLWERSYLPEIVRGLMVTGYRFWRNLLVHTLHVLGLARKVNAAITVQYPEEHLPYPETFRSAHRLTLHEDGEVRCTACFLCATACLADCIYIEASEYPDNPLEKFPRRYEIDTLRCIYCGYCVEACPCDAVRMDTGIHPHDRGFSRKDFIEDKETLVQRSRDLERKGRKQLYEEQVERYRHG